MLTLIDFVASRELGNPIIVLRMPDAAAAGPALGNLSSRERQVAALVAEGLANQQKAITKVFVDLLE